MAFFFYRRTDGKIKKKKLSARNGELSGTLFSCAVISDNHFTGFADVCGDGIYSNADGIGHRNGIAF